MHEVTCKCLLDQLAAYSNCLVSIGVSNSWLATTSRLRGQLELQLN